MKELKKLLVEFKEHGIPSDLIERDLKVDWLEKKANVLAGIRRAGKTYLMFQVMKKFPFDNVFYINLEDDRLINPSLKDLSSLIPLIKQTFSVKGKIYLFVDEIQTINGWEKWARRVAEDKSVILFISGSSSKLTSYEIPTLLRGRSLTNWIYPLNFKEFLRFKQFKLKKLIDYSTKKPTLLRLFNKYIRYGGFPEVVLEQDKEIKLKLLKDYFITILTRDIEERHEIKNKAGIENFMKYLINNFSRDTSFSKATNWLKSIGIKIGKQTLIEYYGYIKESFFVNHTQIFSYNIKDREQYPIKIYLADNGFVTALTIKQFDKGWFYEQSVANELFKKQKDNPNLEIFYYKSKQGYEVDFVIVDKNKVKQLIQVCYNIEEETKKREMRALLHASKQLKCNNLLVITDDYENEEVISWFGIKRKVKFVPLWKWLLK
jgi:hypothetical protein